MAERPNEVPEDDDYDDGYKEEDYDDDDGYEEEDYDDDDDDEKWDDRRDFEDPGGVSALRAASPRNPRKGVSAE